MFDQRAAAPFDESLVPAHARAPAACENECVHLDLSPSLRKDFSVVPSGLDGLRYPLPSTSCWAIFHRPFGTSWFLNPRPALRAGLFPFVPSGLDGLRYPLPSTSCWAIFHCPLRDFMVSESAPCVACWAIFQSSLRDFMVSGIRYPALRAGLFSFVPSGLHGF